MESSRRERPTGRLVAGERLKPFAPARSFLTLSVPARPEALGIVRLVVMSCGAAAGFALDEIFSRSQDIANAFANMLVAEPDATNVVIRTETGTEDVDLVSVREHESRPHG